MRRGSAPAVERLPAAAPCLSKKSQRQMLLGREFDTQLIVVGGELLLSGTGLVCWPQCDSDTT